MTDVTPDMWDFDPYYDGPEVTTTTHALGIIGAAVSVNGGRAYLRFHGGRGPYRGSDVTLRAERGNHPTDLHALHALGTSIVRQIEAMWDARDDAREATDAA